MNRRTLLKVLCGRLGAAAVVVAGRPLFRPPAGRPSMPEPAGPFRPLGFFDVDSRELNKAGDALGFRPRVEPLIDRLNRLYALAEERRPRSCSPPAAPAACCAPTAWRKRSRAAGRRPREWAERLGRIACSASRRRPTPPTRGSTSLAPL